MKARINQPKKCSPNFIKFSKTKKKGLQTIKISYKFMKKLVFGIIATVIFVNLSFGQSLENAKTELLPDNSESVNSMKDFYLMNSSKYRNVDAVKFGEAYKVSPYDDVFLYNGIEVFENLNLPSTYKLKSYLLDFQFKDENIKKRIKYLQRDVSFNNLKFTLLINVQTGNMINFFSNEISEEDFMGMDLPLNLLTEVSSKAICFKTFASCVQKLNLSMQNPIDAATCDWLPCNTIVLGLCTGNYYAGFIQSNTSAFVGTSNCSVIY